MDKDKQAIYNLLTNYFVYKKERDRILEEIKTLENELQGHVKNMNCILENSHLKYLGKENFKVGDKYVSVKQHAIHGNITISEIEIENLND